VVIAATDTPVAIVGGGPVGLAAALELARFGIRSTVFERHTGVDDHPRAHVVNARSVELFRLWGIVDDILEWSLPADHARIVWTTTLAGDELGQIDLTEMEHERLVMMLDASPAITVSVAQDRVQQALLDAVRATGLVDLRFGQEVVGVRQGPDHVTVSLADEDVTAEWCVAADGANGPVRSWVGINTRGMPPLGHQLNISFEADLSAWTRSRPAILYWTVNAQAPGVFINMFDHTRWTFNTEVNPAVDTLEDFPPERCADIVRAAAGVDDLDVDIKRAGFWTMAAEVATRYRKGRIFVAGDAAHRFPPTGGFGMNTGLADAHNLAWKLAGVLHGWAHDSLLDTYGVERRPVAETNSQYSVVNAIKMSDTGVGPTAPAVVAALEAGGETAAAERTRLAAAIQNQRPHFDFLNQELGYSYDGSAAVIADGSPAPSPVDPVRDYTPSARPGARAAHAWVTVGGRQVSTIDLYTGGFVVLAGSAGSPWLAGAVGQMPDELPVEVLVIGVDVLSDSDLHDLYGITPDGVVVVRPDGHVAFRAASRPVDPNVDVRSVLATVCGNAVAAYSIAESSV
jgi:2-polyprenyl-6-methoxyphenol hydroxylase-like FAD-dependent oxidoreductase